MFFYNNYVRRNKDSDNMRIKKEDYNNMVRVNMLEDVLYIIDERLKEKNQ